MADDNKFIQVKCPDCRNVQQVFYKAASRVECLVCGNLLVEPSGGKVKILGERVDQDQ